MAAAEVQGTEELWGRWRRRGGREEEGRAVGEEEGEGEGELERNGS